jgi:hypothetical protein
MLKIYKIEAANSADEAADLANKNTVFPWNVFYDARNAVEINNIGYTGGGNEATLIINYAMGE